LTAPAPPNPSCHTARRDWLDRLQRRLDDRARDGLLRALPNPLDEIPGAIDLRSNDPLRLSTHPRLIAAVQDAAGRFGIGSGASRLVSERTAFVREIEAKIASFKGAERAIITPTGFAANLATLQSIADDRTLILMDKLAHASIIDGARLASLTGTTVRTFAHNDVMRARTVAYKHLEKHPDATVLLVTESVFSMDGDLAPIAELAKLRDEINGSTHASCALILDEAHATGILGETGAGLDEAAGHVADITVSTASKALGALGGMICGPSQAIETVINFGRAFIYSTGAMPIQAAAISEAIDILRDEPDRRARLVEISKAVRDALAPLGVRPFETDPTPIVPVVIGDPEKARATHERLARAGIFTAFIRPPTVPPNSSRLRLSLHCGLTAEEIGRITEAITAAVL